MKKLVMSLCLFVILAVNTSNAAISSLGNVTEITFLGGLWGNTNRGGLTFKTNPMPGGVVYFIIRPTDIATKNFMSLLLSAKASAMKLQVNYNLVGTEGEVVSITIP